MGRGSKEQFLRLVNEKMLYLSSAAAGQVGERADLYEWGNVMALVGNPHGTYHLSPKSAGCRGKNLCASELVGYLEEKYGLHTGARLTVWSAPEEDGPVAFFAAEVTSREADCRFDRRFQKVELTYRKRYGDWVFVEDNCVSFTADIRVRLPRRLALRGKGEILALCGDPEGPYLLEYRNGRKGGAIYSSQLAEYCKERFQARGRSVLLNAAALPDGVCFADGEEALAGVTHAARLPLLDLGDPGDRFLCLMRKGSLYLSAHALRSLGERFSLYEGEGKLALRKEPDGAFQIRRTGYQNLVHSKPLKERVEQCYPDTGKLYLLEREDLLVLCPRREQEYLPGREAFRPLHLGRGRRPAAEAAPRPEPARIELGV